MKAQSQTTSESGYLIHHLPKTKDGIPEGLCHYELRQALGIASEKVMRQWCKKTGYKPIDGRSKYTSAGMSQRARKHPEDHYRKVLEASQNKPLEEVAKELGITRQGAWVVCRRLGIPRANQVKAKTKPDSFAKLKERIMKV